MRPHFSLDFADPSTPGTLALIAIGIGMIIYAVAAYFETRMNDDD